MANRLFRLRQKRSDSQLPQTHSNTDSSAGDVAQPEAASADQNRSGSASAPDLALRKLREFLDGHAAEMTKVDPADKATRDAVGCELRSVIAAPPSPSGPSGNGNEQSTSEGTQSGPESTQVSEGRRAAQERARQLFVDHGYFDEEIEKLRNGASPGERASAARTIGSVGNRLGNVHLIAALFDNAQEVRDAATAALAQLGDSTATESSIASPPVVDEPAPAVANQTDIEAAPAEEVQQEPGTTETPASSVGLTTEGVPDDEAALLLEEAAARKALEDLGNRLEDAASSRIRLEREAEQRLESEARLSSEAAERRRKEEELRQRAEEEASQRRLEEEQQLLAAHAARIKAEEEAQRFAQEDAMLRLEVNRLRVAAEEIARKRTELQAERRVAAERARLAETERTRQEAEAGHRAEIERLRTEEEALASALAETALRRSEVEAARHETNQEALRLSEQREQLAVVEAARQAEAEQLLEAERKTRAEQEELQRQVEAMRNAAAEVAARRAEVEQAREKAASEAAQLVEAQLRMKAAEEARQQAEVERARLEAELIQKAENERRLLDEVRLRAEEEKQRIEVEERYRAAEQEQRLSQLAALRQQLETEAQQRAELERQISSQIESFRLADMQVRKRIEDAEVRRRKAEESYRLVAEKTQRIEAEAKKSEMEEARVLAKLEEARRNVAVAAQSLTEQEKRIKEETEQLRRLEDAQRHRLEEAARSRAEAEYRLQEEKERLQSEEETRLRASEEFERLTAPPPDETSEDLGEWHDDPAENLRPSRPRFAVEPQRTFAAAPPPDFSPAFAAAASTARAPEMAVAQEAVTEASPQTEPLESGHVSALPTEALASPQDEFSRITAQFDDPSPDVRSNAARELRALDPSHMVESFTRALEEASPERRASIGRAIASSGLAGEVIDMLGGESREETYSALCLLLAMAKTGEVQPLVSAIESHDNVYVRIAAVRLLTLNGQEEVANAAARRRLEGNG